MWSVVSEKDECVLCCVRILSVENHSHQGIFDLATMVGNIETLCMLLA